MSKGKIRIRKMQKDQFKKQVLVHKDQMYRLALRILQNEEDAKDIVQDSFLKLWSKRKVLGNIKSIKSFSLTMVRNGCIDNIRKHKPETNKEEQVLARSDHQNPEKQLVVNDELQRVRQIISNLNPQQREVIQLREMEGLDYDEISEITGLSTNNLRVIISRARKEIKLQLMKQMDFQMTKIG